MTYRVDRMRNVRILDEDRLGDEIDITPYSKRVFSMFSGKKERVQMVFQNNLLDSVIDRFGNGSDVIYLPEDENSFRITVEVDISPTFFSWLLTFSDKARIESPLSVRDKFIEHLENTLSNYK